ncbi:hypothetical protein H7J07_05520 [Mycobacterium koreense]|uniref:Uncharacterized protein n=1 Tax=Mycolicibacillus koreensis TaxID=1069220 RepID=A0A7I7SB98_9MYCO|nr:hypothetical protein [Mycolicibacillus koreensis]MCV7247683.1 hypothetical protein [Mycolicibacillus koreensis]OSC34781.1 hypothetical protein B8W67_05910 [Mycolicibacillus koreensis]BBY54068.1 hypothetical protein MKOR_13190 [Mycolicibacillus koreensis]
MREPSSELISDLANALAQFRQPVTAIDALNGEYTVRAHELLGALTAAGYSVVKLPEPCYEGDGQIYFDDGEIRVDTTGYGNEWPRLYVDGKPADTALMRLQAAEMLAAANEADAAYAAADR